MMKRRGVVPGIRAWSSIQRNGRRRRVPEVAGSQRHRRELRDGSTVTPSTRRAYAIAGDTAKAKAAHQGFLTLWKDAEPDIPVLKEAKAEYAKLQ